MGKILKFEYYYVDKLCTRCVVDYNKESIKVENFTSELVLQAFGNWKLTMDSIDEFFRERCFEETRVDRDVLLEMLGLHNFDAEAICRKTHGMVIGDYFWVRFDDENLTFDDIKKLRCWGDEIKAHES